MILSKRFLGTIEEEACFENNIEEEENVSENQAAKVEIKRKTLRLRSGDTDLL